MAGRANLTATFVFNHVVLLTFHMSNLTREKFERMIPELYPRLHRAMRAYLHGSNLDAEDVLQETFLKAYRKYDSFSGTSGVYTWLYTIARNVCIDHFRKNKHDKSRAFQSVEEYHIPSTQKDDVSEEIRLLRTAIAKLPDDLRELVIMKSVDEMGYREISEITGVNEQTLKSRMMKARHLLAISMKKMGVEQ